MTNPKAAVTGVCVVAATGVLTCISPSARDVFVQYFVPQSVLNDGKAVVRAIAPRGAPATPKPDHFKEFTEFQERMREVRQARRQAHSATRTEDGDFWPYALLKPSVAPASEEEVADETVATLKKGRLVYNTPEKMKEGKTEKVEARIASLDIPNSVLTSGLEKGKDRTTNYANTALTKVMKMTLKSADFDVTALGSEEQMLSDSSPTVWSWNIIPKHTGPAQLHLVAIVEVGKYTRDYTTIDRVVTVEVAPLDQITTFIKNNWQWLWTTLLVPLAALFWPSLKKRFSPHAETTPVAPATPPVQPLTVTATPPAVTADETHSP